MRRAAIASVLALAALGMAAFAVATPSGPSTTSAPRQYVVVYKHGVSQAAARAAPPPSGDRSCRGRQDKAGRPHQRRSDAAGVPRRCLAARPTRVSKE